MRSRLSVLLRGLVTGLTTGLIMGMALLAACGGSDPGAGPERVLLVGIESLSLEQIDRMLERGELPNFARLMEEGAHGRVVSPDPLMSPVLWSTLLTGQSPIRHRMTGEYVEFGGGVILAPSSMRVVPTLFQVAGREGQLVASVGFPGTWPVELVNGFNLSYGALPSRMTRASEHSLRIEPGQRVAFPETLHARALDHYTGVEEMDRRVTSDFFTLNETEFSMLYDEPLGSITRHENPLRDWGLTRQRDLAQVALTADLLADFPLRLAGVHLELPESLQPVYWRAAWPDHYEIPADSRRRFRQTIAAGYRQLDAWLGELVAAAGEDGLVCVVGNRGFGNATDPMAAPGEANALRPQVTNRSLLLLHGPGIREGQDLGEVDLVDVAPTLLTALDIAVGLQMDGAVLDRAFTPEFLAAHRRRAAEPWSEGFMTGERYPSQAREQALDRAREAGDPEEGQ